MVTGTLRVWQAKRLLDIGSAKPDILKDPVALLQQQAEPDAAAAFLDETLYGGK